MKLIIDIPEEAYDLLRKDGVDWLGAEHILNSVANGHVLPANSTNGDMIKAIFPNCVVKKYEKSVDVMKLDGMSVFSTIWWNAPYGGDAE